MKVFWGDTHENVCQREECPVSLEDNFRYARSHLDFYAPALYTAGHAFVESIDGSMHQGRSLRVGTEQWKAPEQLKREWNEVQELSRSFLEEGAFVTFPGYEWQGDGTFGDHNVIFREEGAEIARVNTLPELYAALQGRNAMAIPHHTAYQRGARGKDWSVFDDALSPFAEIYSVHGCSETDEEWVGLRVNSKMGPGVSGGTYQDALDRGCHVGAVASPDGTGVFPGRYNWGLMGCLASDLTRDALWDAFQKRRVYAVTGDRIQLDFSINGKPMGSRISLPGPREIEVSVRGADALDRVELLRNGRVLHTWNHQGAWRVPEPGQRAQFKLRIELGWGAAPGETGAPPRRDWTGSMKLPETGRVLGAQPCWICPQPRSPAVVGNTAHFSLRVPRVSGDRFNAQHQNANVFEFEACIEDPLEIEIEGMSFRGRVGDLCEGSRVLWDRENIETLLETRFGLAMSDFERPTLSYLYAHKAKLHRIIPESGYTASLFFEDRDCLDRETNYRVRVEQRNGQRAWSSPVWVTPAS